VFWTVYFFFLGIGFIFDKTVSGIIGSLLFLIPVLTALLVKKELSAIGIPIKNLQLESVLFSLYYIGYMIFLVFWLTHEMPFSDVLNWTPFVIMPGIGLWCYGYRWSSFGISTQNLRSGTTLSLIVTFSLVPLLLFTLHYFNCIQGFISNIGYFLLILPFAFVLAFSGPAVTEEFFFRAVLLERIAQLMKSEAGGIVVTAILNGVYHLPFAYFLPSWPTHGNLMWAISVVVTEQALGAIMKGIIWIKTRNLASTILIHALQDALLFSALQAALR